MRVELLKVELVEREYSVYVSEDHGCCLAVVHLAVTLNDLREHLGVEPHYIGDLGGLEFWLLQMFKSKKTETPPFYSFIVCRLSELHSGHGEPVPISGVIGHQGRIHPGRSANPSQGTHTLSFTTDNLEMPINLPRMSLDWKRKPEYPEKTPKARGEHANSTHTWN
ncbi:hypothetical protein QTP70_030634 [Hemibagrus guttatus]|uniref:Uncharacterized protein n=1 Tax=Hemibagrus guttatus TaxID=175788 RepID=A0AAE0V4Y7_9TELE|nr:hypothetical protein QTP70_030634 [Hemibagrus guttatus]